MNVVNRDTNQRVPITSGSMVVTNIYHWDEVTKSCYKDVLIFFSRLPMRSTSRLRKRTLQANAIFIRCQNKRFQMDSLKYSYHFDSMIRQPTCDLGDRLPVRSARSCYLSLLWRAQYKRRIMWIQQVWEHTNGKYILQLRSEFRKTSFTYKSTYSTLASSSRRTTATMLWAVMDHMCPRFLA